MESRKRPHTGEEESSVTKKRILTGSNGSPHVNGGVVDELDEDEQAYADKIEQFRKEAIYRRMKQYSRENERNLVQIRELERRKTTCEAGLAAISACWAQLIGTIRLLVKDEDLSPVNIEAKEIFDLSMHINENSAPDLQAALGDTVHATEALVTKFVQLGGESRSHLLQDGAYLECQKVQTECVALRSQLNMVRMRLRDCNSEKERYHSALVAAENRLERSQSQTVLAMESHPPRDKPKISHETEDTQRKPSSPSVSSQPSSPKHNPQYSSELEAALELLQQREAKVVELEKEGALLRDEKMILEAELKVPSLESISWNPHYKVLLDHVSHLQTDNLGKREEASKLQAELYQLQESRLEWEENFSTTSAQSLQDLKNMLAKRDVENARLREQREQQASEINERKHRDSVKLASSQELRLLVDARADRIALLQSELSRCKARLAAQSGLEDMMLFFLKDKTDEVEFISSLKAEKNNAQNRVSALEHTLSTYQIDQPEIVTHMRVQADAEEMLSRAKSELEKYKRIYGNMSNMSPDVSELAHRLRSQDAELDRLRLVDTQHKESENSLYTELEKLSTAWEALDRQLKGKIYDLTSLEDRLSKSVVEKAKSENKYFAAMRDKEAIEAERKNLARTLEKQSKVIDRAADVEKQAKVQMGAMEKETIQLKRIIAALHDKISTLERENLESKAIAESEKQRWSAHVLAFSQRDLQLNDRSAQLRKTEEEWLKSRKAMEQEIQNLKTAAPVPAIMNNSHTSNGAEDHMRQLLHCSTCRTNFRSVILTKCMHTFCKACIDARISTRQRKCPACNLAFAQSDVAAFYFQ